MTSFPAIATFKNVTDFKNHLQTIDPDLCCATDVPSGGLAMAQSITIGGRTLNNRWAVHPMEGWDATSDGRPSADTLRRWYNFGLSGSALIWGGEAYAVCPEGRANPNQLHQGSNSDLIGTMRALMSELRRGQAASGIASEETFVGLQLTHSGRWARPTSAGAEPLTMFRDAFLDERVGVIDDSCLLSDADLQELPALYARAATNAQAAGFDFVDIKCCHGYLLHEALSAFNRPGPYGGSFENRTRLFCEIVAAVRGACPDLEIGVRLSVSDDRDNPFDEADEFISLLEALGIRLVNQTIGSPYYCPHVQRPAAFAPCDGVSPTSDPLYSVAAHIQSARKLKHAHPNMIFVGTGYTYLQEYAPAVAEYEVANNHVDFVGLGRMILSYPEMARDHLAGKEFQRKRVCRTFSDCTTAPRNGMKSGCYPLDPEYRARPEAKKVRGLRPPPTK